MSADPALTETPDEHLREMTQHVQALDSFSPAVLAGLLASPALEAAARQMVEAVAALQMVRKPSLATELAPLLGLHGSGPRISSPDIVADRIVAEVEYIGAA